MHRAGAPGRRAAAGTAPGGGRACERHGARDALRCCSVTPRAMHCILAVLCDGGRSALRCHRTVAVRAAHHNAVIQRRRHTGRGSCTAACMIQCGYAYLQGRQPANRPNACAAAAPGLRCTLMPVCLQGQALHALASSKCVLTCQARNIEWKRMGLFRVRGCLYRAEVAPPQEVGGCTWAAFMPEPQDFAAFLSLSSSELRSFRVLCIAWVAFLGFSRGPHHLTLHRVLGGLTPPVW